MAALPSTPPLQGHTWALVAKGRGTREECDPGLRSPSPLCCAAEHGQGPRTVRAAQRPPSGRLGISVPWETWELGGGSDAPLIEAGRGLRGLALSAAPAVAALLASPSPSWAGSQPLDALPLAADGAHAVLSLASLPQSLAQLAPLSLDPVLSLAALLSPLEWPASVDFQNGLAEVRSVG